MVKRCAEIIFSSERNIAELHRMNNMSYMGDRKCSLGQIYFRLISVFYRVFKDY